MIKDKKKRIITRIILIIIGIIAIVCLSGCKKCAKSHKEDSICVSYTPISTGKTIVLIPHYYKCKKTVCDEWAEKNE